MVVVNLPYIISYPSLFFAAAGEASPAPLSRGVDPASSSLLPFSSLQASSPSEEADAAAQLALRHYLRHRAVLFRWRLCLFLHDNPVLVFERKTHPLFKRRRANKKAKH